jgi:hypothetical protein
MNRQYHSQDANSQRRRGVVLLITLVILVILATLGYTLSTRVAARRHRDRYIIGYAQAEYACTSGMKYALASLSNLTAELISRPNEPDFSDVFALTEIQYQQLLSEVGANGDSQRTSGAATSGRGQGGYGDDEMAYEGMTSLAGPGTSAAIPGPYGPRWPLVTEPVELEIGSAKVTIEVEDENAKYPLAWALITDQPILPQQAGAALATTEQRARAAEADVGFRTFGEWMGYGPEELDDLKEELAGVRKLRPFKMEYKAVAAPTTASRSAALRSRVSRTRGTNAGTRGTRGRSVISANDQMDRQSAALARLFHSSLLDTDLLTRPTVVSESRKESAMKYLGLWGARKVNVNTAPRHVLEAALAFGSVADAPQIADAIIKQRRIQPFSDVAEIKSQLLRYSDSVEKCKEFLTTSSTVFTIKVTAYSGVARKVAVAGVTKEGTTVKPIAVISD